MTPPARWRLLEVMGSSAGGIKAHVSQLSAALNSAGHRVVVAAPRQGLPGLGEAPKRQLGWGWLLAVPALARAMAGADAVHAHGLRAAAVSATLVRLRRLRRPRRPRRLGRPPFRAPIVVVTLHNAPPAAGWRAVGANWLGRLAAKADHVLVVSPDLEGWIERLGATAVERAIVPVRSLAPPDSGRAATRRELGVSEFPGSRAPAVPSEDAGPGDRAATSPNAEPADQVATNPAADLGDPFATGQAARPQDPAGTSPNAGPGRPLLVTVARLAHQKGLDILIEAAARLGRRDPAPLWLVAGAGPDRAKLEALIAETGAPVKLLGPRDDVAALYQAADLVVGTSRWEGQPIALREAMTLGAAVVATDVGGTKAALAGGALLTQADAGALADGVGQLLDNPEELRELRRRGAAAARRFPGQAEMLAQALRLYGQRPPAGARNSPRSPRPERNRRRF